MEEFKTLKERAYENQASLTDREVIVALAVKKSKQMRFLRDVVGVFIILLSISLMLGGIIPDNPKEGLPNELNKLIGVKSVPLWAVLFFVIGTTFPYIIYLISKGKIQITPQDIKKAVNAGIEFDYVNIEKAKEMVEHIDENCK